MCPADHTRIPRTTRACDDPNIALVSGFMCCDSDEEAMRRADGWTFFQFALRFYATHGAHIEPGSVNLWEEYQDWKETPSAQKQRSSGLIGSPETIRAKLHKYHASNIDQVILLNQAGKNSHEHICESLELFGREVMPEFHALESEHQEWKRAVLAGDLQLPELETAPHSYATRSRPKPQPSA